MKNGIQWESEDVCKQSWAFAKNKLMADGKLMPNGTKLRRQDYPQILSHSFLVIDGKIIALARNIYLLNNKIKKVKIAEDENKNILVLKIISKKGFVAFALNEGVIGSDLGVTGQLTTRENSLPSVPIKHYLVYKYLGTSLRQYIENHPELSFDERYVLAIKAALILNDLHNGRNSNTKQGYFHGDIHLRNIVIDDQGDLHWIDYELANSDTIYNRANYGCDDIRSLLESFFIRQADRGAEHKNFWIFGDMLGEYCFQYGKPPIDTQTQKYLLKPSIIYLDIDYKAQDIDNTLFIHYWLWDLAGIPRSGTIATDYKLQDYSKHSDESPHHDKLTNNLSAGDRRDLEQRVINEAVKLGYIVDVNNRSALLWDLLTNPVHYQLNESSTITSKAFNIAEVLTLCRFKLETSYKIFITHPLEMRIIAIHTLNAIDYKLFALWEKISEYPNAEYIQEIIGKLLIQQLFDPSFSKDSFLQESIADIDAKDKRIISLLWQSHLDDITKIIAIIKSHWVTTEHSEAFKDVRLVLKKLNTMKYQLPEIQKEFEQGTEQKTTLNDKRSASSINKEIPTDLPLQFGNDVELKPKIVHNRYTLFAAPLLIGAVLSAGVSAPATTL